MSQSESLWWCLSVSGACLICWMAGCCVGCDVAPRDLCIIHQSPVSPVSTLQSPDCKLGPQTETDRCKQAHTLETNLFSWARYVKHSLDDTKSVRVMSSLIKETVLWLKLVFWWHRSPSHPSIVRSECQINRRRRGSWQIPPQHSKFLIKNYLAVRLVSLIYYTAPGITGYYWMS